MQVYLAATCTLAITYNTKDDEDLQPALLDNYGNVNYDFSNINVFKSTLTSLQLVSSFPLLAHCTLQPPPSLVTKCVTVCHSTFVHIPVKLNIVTFL